MEFYGRSTGRDGSESGWPVGSETGLEESMQRFGLWSRELPYPERSGVPDCAFYMRTGSCGYGSKCRYNHPRDRSSVGATVRFGRGEYPERPGELTCQYYSRTGICKFGASCKFHHPRNGGGSMSNMRVNIYGYPLRPGERECSYYLKTGQCKFGVACKFDHPQPGGMSMPEPAHQFYPTVQSSSSVPSFDPYGAASPSYRTGRPPPLPGSYVPGAYGPVLLSPGVVPISGWSPYAGPVSPVLSPSAPHSVGAGSPYGVTQLPSSASAFVGPYPTFPSPAGPSSSTQERGFPERPGQPDCQYYLKTGDCKFGSSCRFHHPPDWVVSKTNCLLSSMGLPMRPGVQPCAFYMQNGHCKFGSTCRFDHPIRTVRYSPSASSLSDMLVAPYLVGSSLATLAPPFSNSEPRPEFISGPILDPPHSSRTPSSGNTSSSSVGFIYSQTVSASLSDVQQSSQSSAPLSISTSTRQGVEVRRSS
ncbi:zinc finger CCCH domain-containing protein 32-like [Camellia sinensis]|uniref:zinc finger CCCH domain-containing protein 32-like n=1 Tax=Camellia sinensis TaxID=4442 RepID=UPI0010365A8A|nr:zinc finger CCCH domain-containing protein 32-like [Camellia sinensis]XP_028055626.1 zinc finger CCCH domain-containing protein 32-like [Camellia sinensis]